MVDDEPNVLAAYRRTLGRLFAITCAEGGAAGLEVIEREGPFAVVVTDMRMPQLNGLEFIDAARDRCRDSVYLMLTGNADLQTAVDAINTGHIFRFLNKPCTLDLLESSIRAAIRQHEMVTAERVLLRDTLTGSIRLMVDALELADPLVGTVQSKVKQLVNELCAQFRLPYDWQFMVAGSVCLIGLVGTQRDKSRLVPIESMLVNAAALGSQLVKNIPRMSTVSNIIARQREVGMLPARIDDHSRENLESIAARFLKVSVDLAFACRAGMTHGAAVEYLASTGHHDPRIIDALTQIPSAGVYAGSTWIAREIKVAEIKSGMVLENDLTRFDGTLLLSRGQPVSELAASNLRSQAMSGLLTNTVQVRIRAAQMV
jgi:ActR/RegA family two-component response regulator